MNVTPVCACVATATKKQKTQSLFEKFSYSFNTYIYLMPSQLSHSAWHMDDLAHLISTREAILKHTNLSLIDSS